MVFQTLNRLKWTGKLEKAKIVILHRGVPGDRKIILGSQILEVKRTYFVYTDGNETLIPNHRVLEIWAEKKLIWKRKS